MTERQENEQLKGGVVVVPRGPDRIFPFQRRQYEAYRVRDGHWHSIGGVEARTGGMALRKASHINKINHG